jgi:hypothetical protein
LAWEMEQAEGRVCLDGVCYRGPLQRFDPAELGEVVIVAGLELLRADQPPAASRPDVRKMEETLEATWPVGRGLEIQAPTRARPYQ